MTAVTTEYDKYLKLFRSILLANQTVDPAQDPTLNPAIDPQLNKNKSEMDKANFIRCVIIATIIEKYRGKAREDFKHERKNEVEVDISLLKSRSLRHMLEELEEDDEEIEKKIKELLAYKKSHPSSDPGLFFDPGVINGISKTLAALESAARNKPNKPHP